MSYYNRMLNAVEDRHWPILSAAAADDEIARLRAHVSQLREENRELRSINRSLKLAIAEQRLVIKAAAMWGKV